MLQALRGVLGMMVIIGALAGCQAMTGQTAGEYVDDAGLTAAIKTQLTNKQVSSLTRVEVETVNGVAHLTGVVKSEAEKAEAARVAEQVNGVKRVNNNLTVQP